MTNFTIQTLAGLPTFCLAAMLLILSFKKNRFRINGFLLLGSFLSAGQFITNEIFWIGDPGTNSIAGYSRIGILFSPVFVLFLYGVLQIILENNLLTTRKQNVLTLAFLFLITFGFYTPFWYIEKHVRLKTESPLVVIFALFLTYSFFLHTYLYADSNAFGLGIWLTVDILTIVLGIALAMNLRASILKKNNEIEINPILTFLFGMFYLQYRMNQLNDVSNSIDRQYV